MKPEEVRSPVLSVRAHAALILAFLAIAAAVTYPLVLHGFSETWLGLHDPGGTDIYMKVWDYWYVESGTSMREAGPFGHTRMLFFPDGVDLGFHSLSLVHASVVWALARLNGFVSGFNLAALLLLMAAGWSAFLLLREMVVDAHAAFYGAVLFAFPPWAIAHLSRHPDLMGVFGMPLLLLATRRALETGRARWAAAAALAAGLLVYTGFYLVVVAALTLVPVVTAFGTAGGRWRKAAFWGPVAALALLSALVLLPRLLPMLRSREILAEVVDAKYRSERSVDALSFVVPCGNPVLAAPRCVGERSTRLDEALYLGLVPLGLAFAGLARREERRRVAGWLALAGAFLLLTLGSTLVVGGHRFAGFPMPRDGLAELLPIPFRAIRAPRLYFLGVLLPFSIASAFGLRALLSRVPGKRAKLAVLALVGTLTLAERWMGELEAADLTVSPFYRQLAGDAPEGALIELPIGRDASKRYLLYQTVHHRPIAEGAISRVPANAYGTIRKNALLRRWDRLGDRGASFSCVRGEAEELSAAARDLGSLGFRMAILHRRAGPGLARDFRHLRPEYRDSSLQAFALDEIEANPPCGEGAAFVSGSELGAAERSGRTMLR